MPLKNREITTRGIVIGRAQSGEGSVRVFVYTEELGLMNALAKSGREERSKLRPHLQSGTSGSYTFVKGQHEWRVVGAVDTVNIHFLLEEKQHAQAAAARVISVIRRLIHGEEANRELFHALDGFFAVLPDCSVEEALISERLAMIRILTSLGYVPSLPDIPHLFDDSFERGILLSLKPFERRMTKIINEAIMVSGLL